MPFLVAKFAFGLNWQVVLFPLYTAVFAIAVVWLALTRVDEHKEAGAKPATVGSCLSLLGNPFVLVMVLGIFVYVGAEVSISSFVPIYLRDSFKINLQTWGILGNSFFFLCILTGRFLGSVVLNWISAQKFLLINVLLALAGLAGLVFTHTWAVALVSIFVTGIGCANIFPMVFSITVNTLPQRANEVAGLMVTAIVGGAVIPPLTGWTADKSGSVATALLVPMACIAYLLIAAWFAFRTAAEADAAA